MTAEHNNNNNMPAGGWFGTVGAIIGMLVGYDFGHSFLSTIIGLVAGAYIGLAVENILYRVLMLLAGLIIFLVRQGACNAVRDGLFNS